MGCTLKLSILAVAVVLANSVPVIAADKEAWENIPDSASCITAGADGSVWAIGTDRQKTGSSILRWNGKEWDKVDGAATKIAVDPKGVPWIINGKGEIFRRSKDSWEKLPGLGEEIAIGGDGVAWIVNKKSAGKGHAIQRWNGKDWDDIDGAAYKIAVDAKGIAWIINSFGDIFRREKDAWEKVPGNGKEIAAGADGSIWMVTTKSQAGGFHLARWDGKDWAGTDGVAIAVAVDKDGKPWVINNTKGVLRRK
jgi:hypothetical protein